MEAQTIEVTYERTPVDVVEGLNMPDFAELEKERKEEKQEMLEGLRGLADGVRHASSSGIVTLQELCEVLGVDRSSLRKHIKKNEMPHDYMRALDAKGTRQRQMVFTKAEAEIIIQEYFSG